MNELNPWKFDCNCSNTTVDLWSLDRIVLTLNRANCCSRSVLRIILGRRTLEFTLVRAEMGGMDKGAGAHAANRVLFVSQSGSLMVFRKINPAKIEWSCFKGEFHLKNDPSFLKKEPQ